VVKRVEDGQVLVELASASGAVEAALARAGEVPLPPYIKRAPNESDEDRYQTVFAARPGAVAAPTAGLHFSRALLAALAEAGHRTAHVTLHVGPGTFRPVAGESLDGHAMHRERYEVSEEAASAIAQARADGRPVVAVGTTVVRTLESAAREDGTVSATSGSTSLFIRPPFRFRVVDSLLTNFHLPRSTLLALVMAFGGVEEVRAAYDEAVRARYRFFSYGDAMLLRGHRP
jgi:S-adenosylmethionine:tRNA ribosyltransferase-isomerase